VNAILLGQAELESPEWHAMRSRGIGGSEAASIVGLSPWTSAFALWHRKRGTVGEQTESQSMNWGKRLEPVIMQAFREKHGLDEYLSATWQHPERTWQIGNPDGFLDGTPVDAKTDDKNHAHAWGPDGTDEIPPYYRCQLVHYGDVFGVREGWIALLLGGNDFRTYRIRWEESEAAWLRGECERFWQSVQDGIPPALDGSDSTYQTVRELHPDIDGTDYRIPDDLMARWRDAKTHVDAWTQVAAQAKSEIANEMGSAQYAVDADGERVFRRQSKQGGTPFVVAIEPKSKETAA